MKYNLFGKHTGLYASELILGASMFGSRKGYGAGAEVANQILTKYTDAGGNIIDIADQYQLGEAEEVVGRFVAPNRGNYIICTKYTRSSEALPAVSNMGNHRKAMKQAVELSLKRLKTDYIDIYMPHFDDGITAPDEIARGLDDLVREGKVLYTGLANFPAWKAAAVAGAASLIQSVPLAAIQVEYNLLQRHAERELLPMAAHFGIGTMLYSPLAGGQLTGKYRLGETGRMNVMGNAGEESSATKAVIDQLITIADGINTTPGQVALAWALTRGGFPIIGARALSHLNDAIKATEISLNAEQIAGLNKLSDVPLGYPHELLATVQIQHER